MRTALTERSILRACARLCVFVCVCVCVCGDAVAGYDEGGPGNIYFGAVKANPLDGTQATLLGLFAVNLGKDGESNGIGKSFVGLSISCDGQFWAPMSVLARTQGARSGRTYDQPVGACPRSLPIPLR